MKKAGFINTGIIIVLIFGFVMVGQIFLLPSDYDAHLRWAEQFSRGEPIHLPHPVFVKSVFVIRALLPYNLAFALSEASGNFLLEHSFTISAFLLAIACHLATFGLVFRYIPGSQAAAEAKPQGLRLLSSLFVVIAAPLLFFLSMREHLQWGYIYPNTYHNPTVLLLNPLAILIFFHALEHCFSSQLVKKKDLLELGLLLFFATFAKPSFTLTIVPAVFLLALIFLFKKQLVNWRYLLTLCIVSVAILGLQFLGYYGHEGSDQMMVAPFREILVQNGSIGRFVYGLVMSLAMPLAISLVYWKTLVRDRAFQLAWLNFGIALGLAILVCEVKEIGSGNFFWGANIAALLLYLVTISHWFRQINLSDPDRWRKPAQWVLISLFILHLSSGIVYFIMRSPFLILFL